MVSLPRSGYTLPVFACAAAIAALRWLQHSKSIKQVLVSLIEPAETVEIEIAQVAGLSPYAALAIAYSDPGDNLDLTRDTPIWAYVAWGDSAQTDPVQLMGGEGVGKLSNGQPAIYRYAQRLLQENLIPLLQQGETIQVTIILPEGRNLAKRTSNAAFGVVEGLSLLGTSGISQPLTAPEQLELYRAELRQKIARFNCLVFCVGENGLNLSQQLGIPADCLVKTANWLGPMLVEAGMQGVQSILLFGYHGKLLKLAGGIFHTHHHVADGRREILTALGAQVGLPTQDLQAILACPTAEDALAYLQTLDLDGSTWTQTVYQAIAETIDQRSQSYIQTHSNAQVAVGCILFNRQREIIVKSKTGRILLNQVCSIALQ